MGVVWILAQVLAAMMVTVGVLSMMQWLRRRVLALRQITVAVTVACRRDMENLDILLSEAAAMDGRVKGVPLVVLVSCALVADEEGFSRVAAVAEAYGAVWYAVDMEGNIPSQNEE